MVLARADPSRPILRETAARHDAVDMRVEPEVPCPGVKNGGDAELCAEPLWIRSKCQKSLTRGAEEQIEEELAIEERQGVEVGGDREDDMEVVRRQDALLPLLDPLVLLQRLTF